MKGSDIAIVLGGGPGKGRSSSGEGGGDYEAAIDDMVSAGVTIKDRKLFRQALMAFVEECMAHADGDYNDDDAPKSEPAPADEARD